MTPKPSISLLLCTVLLALSIPSPSPAEEFSARTQLSPRENEKLESAKLILKKLDTYKKSRFTRLLNSGKKPQIMALPGIGDATADRIIKSRPYETSAHVVLVRGVGLKTFEEMVESRL